MTTDGFFFSVVVSAVEEDDDDDDDDNDACFNFSCTCDKRLDRGVWFESTEGYLMSTSALYETTNCGVFAGWVETARAWRPRRAPA